MIRSRRGFSTTEPHKDMEAQGEEVAEAEDDIVSSKTQESSMADAEVSSLCPHFLTAYLFI